MSLSHDASYWHDATNRDWPTWPEQLPALDEDEVANAATWADTKRPQLQTEIRERGNRVIDRFRDETPERIVRHDYARPLTPMTTHDEDDYLRLIAGDGLISESFEQRARRRRREARVKALVWTLVIAGSVAGWTIVTWACVQAFRHFS